MTDPVIDVLLTTPPSAASLVNVGREDGTVGASTVPREWPAPRPRDHQGWLGWAHWSPHNLGGSSVTAVGVAWATTEAVLGLALIGTCSASGIAWHYVVVGALSGAGVGALALWRLRRMKRRAQQARRADIGRRGGQLR